MTIEQLLAKSARMHKLKTDPEFLFAELQNISPEVLDKYEKLWRQSEFRPVITLRYLLTRKIKNKEKINQEVINELKAAIERRDLAPYGEFEEGFLKSLRNYSKSDRGMFPQWSEPFRIFYELFYTDEEQNEIKNFMKTLGEQVIAHYQIKDAKVHVVGFEGGQYYGSDNAWAVIIPGEANGPKEAFHLYFSANQGKLEGGLGKGDNVKDPDFEKKEKSYSGWEEFVADIEQYIPRWEQFNNKLDFSISKKKPELKKGSDKSNPEDLNYWVFQANPKVYNVVDSLRDGVLKSWSVSAHKNSIKIGDKVILWKVGENPGCYALCKVTSEIRNREDDELEQKYYTDLSKLEPIDRVSIEVEVNLCDKPILQDQVKSLPEFKNFNAGRQGTNFSATKEEYLKILELSGNMENRRYWLYSPGRNAKYWDEFYNAGIMALGWDGLGDLNQYQSREEITKKLQEIEKTDTSKKNDTTANYEFFKIMKVGDIVIAKKGIKEFIGYGVVTSDYYYDPERENYRSCRKVNWIKKGTWLEEKGGIVVKTLTDITTYPTYPKRLGELLGFNVSGNVLMADNNHIPLNTIMFGPPGTGKTYHTVGEAMKIVDPEFYKANKDFTLRKVLRQRYQELLIKDWEATTGQIGFCTFHQSFSYEDFVEGIRPKEPQEGDTYLKYEVEEGIFKRICRLAEDNLKSLSQKAKHLISIPSSEFASASFYKISLGDINDPADQEIYDYCVENGLISIGFGDGIDFKGKDESGVNEAYTEKYRDNGYGAQAINFFKNYLKVGNYVVVSKGNFYVRAIGKVIGEYFYDPKTTIRHKHFRKVDWLFKDQEIPIQDIYEKNLSQQTIYKLKSDWIKREFFVKSSESSLSENNNDPKKFVVIIDEINRGNVASIFGELITLIERDKRAGKEEATEVVLPYSKEKFSVPANLYIIGTMNTADRSIEALDTALRRRFSFREMPPKPELIKTEGALKETEGRIGTIDVVELLETINKRLEKLIDKDHRIGHSYFMHIKTEAELKVAFKDKVIPLLEEYFFGDFGKIGLVLGNSFVEKVKENAVFAKFEDYGSGSQDLAERPVYRIKGEDEWNFSSIYE